MTGTRLVLKVGSSLLVAPDGSLRRDWLASLVADIAAERAAGTDVCVVSSGAIALGARRLGLPRGGRASLEDAQAAAATGQVLLAALWAELLSQHGLTGAQMLVTLDDLEDRRRYLNASATLSRLFGLGVVPVVNENDSVATEEIRFGDNDRLAARVAQAAQAHEVLLLSDVAGLHDRDPNADPAARLIAEVETIDDRVLGFASGRTGSGMGSGGMASKLEAARIATAAGIPLAIAAGTGDHPLAAWRAGGRGTRFRARPGAAPRKTWLAGRLTVKGRIGIDAGACAALAAGNSLLARGATAVDGRFARGDPVDIVHGDRPVARGLSEYDAADAARILGLHRDEQAAVLGYAPRAALVHRDHLVLLR